MEIDVYISALLALCSIALQIYSKFYMRERRTKKERTQAREKRMSQGKKTGDVINLRCPSCSQDAPHKVINRKRGPGFEVMVNCRGAQPIRRGLQLPPHCNRGQLLITMARFPRPSIQMSWPTCSVLSPQHSASGSCSGPSSWRQG